MKRETGEPGDERGAEEEEEEEEDDDDDDDELPSAR